MNKKYIVSSLLIFVLSFCAPRILAETSSSVTANLSSGELTMIPPQSPSVNLILTGSDREIQLPMMQTVVKDLRGINSGWTLSVKADNYNSFKKYIELQLKSKSHKLFVNQAYQLLTEKQNQTLFEVENYLPTIKLSHNTPSKDYTLKLSWNLSINGSIIE